MRSTRLWHAAVVGTALVLSTVVLLTARGPWQAGVGLAATAAFVVVWFAIGLNADQRRLTSVGFAVMLVVVAGVGTAAVPAFATFQTIAYPLAWTRARDTRTAVLTNVGLALAVGIGLFLGAGADTDALLQAIVIQVISLGFTMAMGLWITSISNASDERQRLLDELRLAQDSLAAVNRDTGIASERERLAREIHDTIAQDLTGLVMLTQQARRELDAGDTVALGTRLGLLEESARSALAETRGLVAATAPVGLASGGIHVALERLADRFGRETGVSVGVEIDALPALARDAEVVLLRIAQEALSNVRKHATARAVGIGVTSDGDSVILAIRDDGTGFDPAQPTLGFGLGGMSERLALVGGALEITSSRGAGTALVATLPLGGAR